MRLLEQWHWFVRTLVSAMKRGTQSDAIHFRVGKLFYSVIASS